MLREMIKFDGKKNLKKGIVYISVLGMLLSTRALAAEKSFVKTKVDSNEWTYIVTATKADKGETCKVEISNIYKANGSNSNYEAVRGVIRSNTKTASVSSNIRLGKKTTTIALLEAYQAKGTILSFYSMGNNPSLDCKISGTFYVQ